MEGEGLLQPAAVLIDQRLGPLEVQVWPVGEEPATEEGIAGQHPAGEGDDDGIGVEGIGMGQQVVAAGADAAMVAIARQRCGPLDGSGGEAVQVVLDGGKTGGRATKAQVLHHRPITVEAGLLIGEGGPEMEAAAVVLQPFGPLQGPLVLVSAAAAVLLLLEGMELLEGNGGEQAMGLADGVVLEQQPPAVVMEHQLQGPEGGGVAVDGAQQATTVLDGGFDQGKGGVEVGIGWWCGLQPAAEGGLLAGVVAAMGETVLQDGHELAGVGITEIGGVEVQQLTGGEQLVFGEEGGAEGITAAAAATGGPEAIGGEGVVEGGLHLPRGPEATLTTGGGGEALGEMAAHLLPRLTVVGVVEEMAEEGEDVEEGDAIGQARQAADGAWCAAGPWRRIDHRPVAGRYRLPGGGEAHGIEPVEIGGDGGGVVVTGAMETTQQCGGTVGDTGGGKGSEELLQFGIEGGVRRGQLWMLTQQPQEVEEAFEIEQARVAMQFMGGITVGATVNAEVKA